MSITTHVVFLVLKEEARYLCFWLCFFGILREFGIRDGSDWDGIHGNIGRHSGFFHAFLDNSVFWRMAKSHATCNHVVQQSWVSGFCERAASNPQLNVPRLGSCADKAVEMDAVGVHTKEATG